MSSHLKPHDESMLPSHAATNDFAYLFFGIYMSLSGRQLEGFDIKSATKAVFAVFDWDKDGLLGKAEAKMLGLSPAIVGVIDSNEDAVLSLHELIEAQLSMIKAGCVGTTVVAHSDTEISFRPPLSGMHMRHCSFLIMPNWYFVVLNDKAIPHSSPAAQGRSLLTLDRAGDGSDMLLPIDIPTVMPFIVKVETYSGGQWSLVCTGVLIEASLVLVDGACGKSVSSVGSRVSLHNSTEIPVAQVRSHPVSNLAGSSVAALLFLLTPATGIGTAQLQDSTGLDIGGCKNSIMAVGSPVLNQGQWMQQQEVKIISREECLQHYSQVYRINPVNQNHLCASPSQDAAAELCFDQDSSILVAPHPEDSSVYIVIGLADLATGGCGVVKLPLLFSSMEGILQWVLSTSRLGDFPPLMLSLIDLHLASESCDSSNLTLSYTVKSGSSAAGLSLIASNKGVYYEEETTGALLVQVKGSSAHIFQQRNIKLQVVANKCGSMPNSIPGGLTRCTDLKGCMIDGGQCVSPKCIFSPSMKKVVTEFKVQGKAFKGGLGQARNRLGLGSDFTEWVCVRDWDRKEQISCGVGHGELHCFGYVEHTKEWISLGPNQELRVVSSKQIADSMQRVSRK